jgi:hypothetical protein
VTDTLFRPPPAPPPPAAERRVDPAPRRLVALALGSGVLFDIGLRGGLANLVVAIALLLVVTTLVSDHRLGRTEARVLAGAAAIPAAFLALRASPWLAWSNALCVVALLGAAVAYSRSGSFLDTTLGRWLVRSLSALAFGAVVLGTVRHGAPSLKGSIADRLAAVLRAAVVVVPILAVVVVLLASGDAVFAGLILHNVDVVRPVGHVLLTLTVAAAVLWAGLACSVDRRYRDRPGRFGVTEVVTMLGLTASPNCGR